MVGQKRALLAIPLQTDLFRSYISRHTSLEKDKMLVQCLAVKTMVERSKRLGMKLPQLVRAAVQRTEFALNRLLMIELHTLLMEPVRKTQLLKLVA